MSRSRDISSTIAGARDSRLGNYRLLRRIAVGGMAEVFEATSEDPELPDRFVLKVLLPQVSKDPELASSLADEARLCAALSHPNLVRTLRFEVIDSQPVLAMEYVDGPTLAELLHGARQHDVPFPPPLTLHVAAEMLRALEYVHQARSSPDQPLGIVHRDVNPSNVLISWRGEVKLGDFGIARLQLRAQRTQTGLIKGKLNYLAPEQVTGSRIDARTDIYGVGLTLFELLTGRRYIEGATDLDLVRAAEAPVSREPSSVSPVDPLFDQVVTRALKRFPEQRYASARAFLEAVENLAGRLSDHGNAEALAAFVQRVTPEDRRAPPTEQSGPVHTARERSRQKTTRVDGQALAQRQISRQPRLRPAGVVGVGVVGLGILGWWLRPMAPQPAPATTEEPPPGLVASPSTPIAVDLGPAPTRPASPGPPTPGARERPTRKAVPSPPSLEVSTPPPSPPDPELPAIDRAALTERLDRILPGLRQRGILREDLSPEQRATFDRIREHIGAARRVEAERELDIIEAAMSSLVIDESFVRAKLARISRRIEAVDGGDVNAGTLETLSSAALQDLMDGRLAATNRRLNEIWDLLQTTQP